MKIMNKCIKQITVMFSIGMTACVSVGDNRYTPLSDADYGNWEIRNFPKAGFKVESPRLITLQDQYLEAMGESDSAYFSVDPILPPRGMIADHYPRVQFTVSVMTKERFEQNFERYRRSGLYQRGDAQSRDRWYRRYSVHNELHIIESNGFRYYRKDILRDDGSYLSFLVEYIKEYGRPQRLMDRDDEMIRRILESVELITAED
jgi:hypothetical protein